MSLLKRTINIGVLWCVVSMASVGCFAQESDNAAAGFACETPRKEAGFCILIKSCPSLYALVHPQNRTKENLIYLKQVTCGYEGRAAKVCCPLDSSMQNVSTTSITPKPWQTGSPPSTPTGSSTTPEPDSSSGVLEEPVDVSTSSRLSMLPLQECGPSADKKIIEGKEADLKEFSWMALLGYETSSDQIGFHCGGTLINNRYVLTAAHCVKTNLKLVIVRLGELHIANTTDCVETFDRLKCADPVEDYAVEEIVPHENSSSPRKFVNNIALIRLNQTVNFTDYIKPICLPIGPEQRRNLVSKMIVTGWGLTEDGFRSPHLLKVSLPLVQHSSCVSSYSSNKIKISPTRQLCAGGKGDADSCSGDSGGPLQSYGEVLERPSQMVQYGIVSFGPKVCATENLPGVYTRVGYYMDWILDHLRP